MTDNKRIFVNVIATYGRSLYAMICGVFASRWALSILGETDYGLYGVIGGLTIFVSFLNTLMASAVSRFYAYSVGAQKMDEIGLDNQDCCKWFNTAVIIHTILPVLLVAVGYPAGLYYIKHFLVFPDNRLISCIWVWRFACASCFVGMCSVPYQAMFVAKQEIAELTIYSVFGTTLQMVILYWLVSHDGEWLSAYAACMSLVSILPNLLIVLRAKYVFNECRLKVDQLFDVNRMCRLVCFAGARFMATLSRICSVQGAALLVNKWLGPGANATLQLGNVVNNQTSTLANSFNNALQPAITNAVGARNIKKAHLLTMRACSLSSLGCIIFTIPLSLEIDYVLRLWLKNPPAGLSLLVILILIAGLIERLTDGFWMEILAFGKIAKYQAVESAATFSVLFLASIFLWCGYGIASIGVALIVSRLLNCMVQIFFCKSICGISVFLWVRSVFCPIFITVAASLFIGSFGILIINTSFIRLLLTTIISEVALLPLAWFLVLDKDMRSAIMARFVARNEKL